MTERQIPESPFPSANQADLFEDPRVLAIVEEYESELEAGRKPDREEYLRRHPELSSVVAECLDGLEMVHRAVTTSSGDPFRSRLSSVHTPGTEGTHLPSALGDFQIVCELARGGMGIVYEAVQLSLGRRVALKVLPFAATLDERQLQRFKNEAQAAAQLHHRSIVPIYAFGCERGVHYYAMQLIEGQSLAAVIRQLREQAGLSDSRGGAHSGNLSSFVLRDESPPEGDATGSAPAAPRKKITLPVAERSTNVTATLTDGGAAGEPHYRRIARLMTQAAEALEHAHQSGVVHRDIKPGNLLVNVAGNLWVADFGLAQFQVETGLTRTGDLLGTFRYMSPEQTAGGRVLLDHRTDIYSLGATFYELLTLQPACDGETRHQLLYQILETEPAAPRSIAPGIPAELETIVLKALAKSPSDRYSSSAELAADLQRYLTNQPILARRPTLSDRIRKWARRHPSAVIAGGLFLFLMTVGLLISNWLISREQRLTAEARDSESARANEAEESVRQARKAVDFMVETSETELADNPGPTVQGARRRLLETALKYYQGFIEQGRGEVAGQESLAEVQERVKGILHELTVIQREMHVWLLENSEVQEALTLEADQKQKLAGLLKKWSTEREEILQASMQLSEEARRKRVVEMAEEHERALAGLLTPSQRQRLNQIALQAHGIFAFKDQDVIQALQLTPAQLIAIRRIEKSVFGFRIGPPPGRGRNQGDPKRDHGHVMSRRASVEKVLEQLTEGQREKWNQLTGAPFEGFAEGPFRMHSSFGHGAPPDGKSNGPPRPPDDEDGQPAKK